MATKEMQCLYTANTLIPYYRVDDYQLKHRKVQLSIP